MDVMMKANQNKLVKASQLVWLAQLNSLKLNFQFLCCGLEMFKFQRPVEDDGPTTATTAFRLSTAHAVAELSVKS